MSKYKCAQALCLYVSDEPGECCGQPLVKISDEKAEEIAQKKKESGDEKGKCSCC